MYSPIDFLNMNDTTSMTNMNVYRSIIPMSASNALFPSILLGRNAFGTAVVGANVVYEAAVVGADVVYEAAVVGADVV